MGAGGSVGSTGSGTNGTNGGAGTNSVVNGLCVAGGGGGGTGSTATWTGGGSAGTATASSTLNSIVVPGQPGAATAGGMSGLGWRVGGVGSITSATPGAGIDGLVIFDW